MASRSLILALPASLATGLGFWFGTGLDPVWWITWLAPLPVFLVAARLSARGAFAMAWFSWVIGALNMWSFLAILPLGVRLLFILLPGAAFAVGVAGLAHFARRGKPGRAALAPAALVTTFEFVHASVSPHGTYGSLAYTQADCLPVLQLAALGGIWPVVFLLMLVPALAALACVPGRRPGERIRIGATCVGLAAVVAAWGALRLGAPARGASLTVGLVASDLPENQPFRDPEAAAGVLDRYLAAVPRMAAAGAELVLMPEHLLSMREAAPQENAAILDRRLHASADANGVVIVIGLDRTAADGPTWNEARLYVPRSPGALAYQKHHLLPGLESFCTPGQDLTTFEFRETRIGLAICKDMDFPSTGRAYARRGIDLLCVPAFDFVADAWLHSRMAVVRGVESGFAVARSARCGLLTLSDSCGRVLAEARSDSAPYATLVAAIEPQQVRTVYASRGDWFGWTAIGVCLCLAGTAWRRRATE